MRALFAFICTGLVFVIFGGMVLLRLVPPIENHAVTAVRMVPATLQPTSASAAAIPAGWATYTNSVLGFSIAYPLTMQLETFGSVAKNQGFGAFAAAFLCDYGPQYEPGHVLLLAGRSCSW